MWANYHSGDEGCVTNVLNVCGQHVKRVFIYFKENYMITVGGRKLVEMLRYCANVTHKLSPINFKQAVQSGCTAHASQWNGDIQKLLAAPNHSIHLNKLKIRTHPGTVLLTSENFDE